MKKHASLSILLSGAAAGCVSGLFGAGGGMVLVPLLSRMTGLNKNEIFPASVAIILPVCFAVLIAEAFRGELNYTSALPYLIGSVIGGTTAGIIGPRTQTIWLHRILGLMILWGGYNYIWQ